jgi:hypothetical protein
MSVSGPIAATAGAVSGTKLSTPVVHVAGLAGLSPAQGDRAYVDDATATTFHSIPVGGGTNAVPVNYDGTNWRIG